MKFKSGQIINEYSTKHCEADKLYSSYLILNEGGWQNMHWECLCIFANMQKPGHFRLIKKERLVDCVTAKLKGWTTYWKIESEV